eukprot:1902085-Amphidinium_carterae.6
MLNRGTLELAMAALEKKWSFSKCLLDFHASDVILNTESVIKDILESKQHCQGITVLFHIVDNPTHLACGYLPFHACNTTILFQIRGHVEVSDSWQAHSQTSAMKLALDWLRVSQPESAVFENVLGFAKSNGGDGEMSPIDYFTEHAVSHGYGVSAVTADQSWFTTLTRRRLQLHETSFQSSKQQISISTKGSHLKFVLKACRTTFTLTSSRTFLRGFASVGSSLQLGNSNLFLDLG